MMGSEYGSSGVKALRPFIEAGLTGFGAEPSIPRPVAHGWVCPNRTFGAMPWQSEVKDIPALQQWQLANVC